MKVRKELNERLYNKKMDELPVPDLPWKSVIHTAISAGETSRVSEILKDNKLNNLSKEHIFSKDILKNNLYHFVLEANVIAYECIGSGMGKTEANTIAEIYIQKADACKAVSEMEKIFDEMCSDYAERMGEIRKETISSIHIRKCVDYIYENLGADLSVNALSKELGLNPIYLSRLFRKELNIPIKRFVKEARIDTAKNLLRSTNMTYLKISASLGFSSQSAFISVFKEIVGLTPKEFRICL